MNSIQSSLSIWRELYRQAIAFKKLSPWNWMYDSDLFGVQNPKTQEVGYCCVMGKLKEVFALVVYRGAEGLEGYMKIASGEIGPGDPDVLHLQNCLMASFKNRGELDQRDLEVIKKTELKFHGQNDWPQFRSYKPGFHPWYLTNDEAEFLILALGQTIDIASRFQKDERLLEPSEDDKFLIRVAKEENGQLIWRDIWQESEEYQAKTVSFEPPDIQRIKKIQEKIFQYKTIWEVDCFYAPTAVRDKEIPYYPRMMVVVDQNSRFIINTRILQGDDFTLFQDTFIKAIEQSEIRPAEIWVRQEELAAVLKLAAGFLNIKVKRVSKFKSIPYLKRELFKFFGRMR